jgi:hypothetical protein
MAQPLHNRLRDGHVLETAVGHISEGRTCMTKQLEPINWKEFPATADFEGVAIIKYLAESDDKVLESPQLPVAKRGNELVFIGPEFDLVTLYQPERDGEFPERVFVSALSHAAMYHTSFASHYTEEDGALKEGSKWWISLFKNAD